jgi:signal transduction histidine kinase
MNLTDGELIQELITRFAQSRKAFSDLSVVNRKLLEMNQRLEQSESLKSNFLSNIRNEINNPLNAIIGLAGLLTTPGQGSGDVAGLASLIYSEANNLDFQLRNIFMAAELEAGEVDPHFAMTNVTAVVNDVADSFRHSAARKSVTIELELPQAGAPLLFATDAEKLQIIMSNLLANAVEFNREGGIVTVFVAVDGDGHLVCAFCDTGIGIAEDDKRRIFDRFIQLESGTTRTHPGQGLGLSITKALIDLLQGSIAVDSMPEQGALFTVTIPPASLGDDGNTFAEGGNLFLFDEMSEK